MRMKNWNKIKDERIIEGEWYEIGFLCPLSNRFSHKGIVKFNEGLKDCYNYHIRPTPSHVKRIRLTEFDVEL